MAPLLAAFYREAHLDELWTKVQPYFDEAIAQLHEPVSHAVLQVKFILENPTSGYLGRRFQIYVDCWALPLIRYRRVATWMIISWW